ILYGFRFFAYSRTVLPMYALLLLIAVTLSRASFRLLAEGVRRQRQAGHRAVIYGAGDGAGLVIRELGRDDRLRIIGFIDDDPRKAGNRTMGHPVLGGYSALTVLVQAGSVDSVVISTRHMAPERLSNLETLCASHGVQLSRLRVNLEAIVDVEAPSHIQAVVRSIKQ